MHICVVVHKLFKELVQRFLQIGSAGIYALSFIQKVPSVFDNVMDRKVNQPRIRLFA